MISMICSLFFLFGLPTIVSKVLVPNRGFFGMIGPNIHIQKSTTLFDLFKGNGIVQGVFFGNNGTIHPVKHQIQTDRILFQEDYQHFLRTRSFSMPNMMGVANTAILMIRNRTFALFERDTPYEIDIDMETKTIHTIGKLNKGPPYRFSGHTKYDVEKDIVHTIDYNIFTRVVTYYKMTSNFTILDSFSKQLNHFPIIHDFKVLENTGNVLFIESPFQLFPTMNRVPIVLRNDLPTKIHIIGNTTSRTFTLNNGFYCFHYGDIVESNNDIRIYASLYDALDFNSLNLYGKYRSIVLKKEFNTCFIVKNPILETMNLDFPIPFGDFVILRRVIDTRIGGYVICRGIDIERIIDLPDHISAFGEHAVKEIEGQFYIMTFCQDGSLAFININDENDITTIPVFDHNITLGFHSISF